MVAMAEFQERAAPLAPVAWCRAWERLFQTASLAAIPAGPFASREEREASRRRAARRSATEWNRLLDDIRRLDAERGRPFGPHIVCEEAGEDDPDANPLGAIGWPSPR